MPSRREFFRIGAGAVTAGVSSRLLAERRTSFEPRRASPKDGLILLYSNENPYGPSPKVLEAITRATGSVNRYPRMRYQALRERIAAMHRVSPDRVLLGCGSTELLRMAACASLGNGKQLIHASPTFEAMQHYAAASGSDCIGVPLMSRFGHDLDGMLERVKVSTGLVYICNPNNPTASLTPRRTWRPSLASSRPRHCS